MIGEPRTLARIVELLHIPIQHSVDQLRDVYVDVSKSCGYENFRRTSGGATLETVGGGGAASRVTFAGDRITFQEEQTNLSTEHLLRRIEEVVSKTSSRLSLPVFIARNITLRALVAAPMAQHSSQFIAENLFQLTAEDMSSFERPGSLVGFRMQFPPTDPKSALHQVRIESYLREPRSLFLEDVATFKVPLQSSDQQRVAQEVREVESFLHERLTAFLSQFPRS